MSSIYVIAAIIILMVVLMSYAFINQSLMRKREQRKRLLRALKSRSNTFKYMANGFPQGFLPPELKLLVHRTLADVSEQLAKLEPENPNHMADYQISIGEISENKASQSIHSPPKLETHQQIKEAKICLEELHKNVLKLEQKSVINPSVAGNYKQQIQHLLLKATVDDSILQAEQAVMSEKTKLAIHHYSTAIHLLEKNDVNRHYQAVLSALQESLNQQQEKLGEQPITAEEEELLRTQAEWDKMESGEDLWKKKNLYD